jgi:hypothetical protein
MYVGDRVSQQFFDGLETFLEVVAKFKKPKGMFVGHTTYVTLMLL